MSFEEHIDNTTSTADSETDVIKNTSENELMSDNSDRSKLHVKKNEDMIDEDTILELVKKIFEIQKKMDIIPSTVKNAHTNFHYENVKKNMYNMHEEKKCYKNLTLNEKVKKIETEVKTFNQKYGSDYWYKCEECHNRGVKAVLRYKKDGNPDLFISKCKCFDIRKANRIKDQSGLYEMCRKYTFENFRTDTSFQEIMLKAAKKYVLKERNDWFYIGGQSGSGKTHICTAIIGNMNPKWEAVYMPWREKIDIIRFISQGKCRYDEYKYEMEQYLKPKILFIDDFLKTPGSNPTYVDLSFAYSIINYRYAREDLITIITSELSLPEILKLDEAIAGRIAERCTRNSIVIIPKDKSKNFRIKNICPA